MRAEDAAEVLAARGHSPIEALGDALWQSTQAFTLVAGDKVLCMTGLIPLHLHNVQAANAWLLTGDAVESHKVAFLRASRFAITLYLEEYPVLVNYIDARYSRALAWAKWLGFDVCEARPYGIDGEPFHEISLRRTPWAEASQAAGQ
jgi:hypothetical protein